MPRALDDPGLDDAERKALADVSEFGLHVVLVLPEGDTPGWAYSVGLFHNFSHPEVVVFGLRREVAHHLLNHLADEIRAGNRFEPGGEYPDLLEGVRCTFREVSSIWNYPFLGWADWFYEGGEYPVLQCIWPDREQRYPWSDGFPAEWVLMQPLLFENDPEAARTTRLLQSMGLWRDPPG